MKYVFLINCLTRHLLRCHIQFKKMTKGYFAVFEKDKENPNFINVSFPDIINAVTFGEGFEDALKMAKDCLKTVLSNPNFICPKPSTKEELERSYVSKMIVYIEIENE